MEEEKTRIYVGGLGVSVTEDDLRRTFSALGQVVSVDVVRTKGRSFAYLDFLPSSDKSLPKLFSTYNGCMWKGGKLRLEKAKEHYLVRLKREWQEEEEKEKEIESEPEPNNCNSKTISKPKEPSLGDKPQLNLFFPKLGKVKSLAAVGIGKHKYSFQRLQGPSKPIHFCDCEEHSITFLPTNKNQLSETEIEKQSDGINEQELNIMNSVMNKIFEKANPSNDELDNAVEEDHLTDEDNLIINVSNSKSDTLDLIGEMKTMMANWEPVAKKLVSSGEKPNKKRKSLENGTTTSSNSQIHLDTLKNSRREKNNSSKSTWKDLIGNTPFSIGDIITDVPQQKEEEFKEKDLVFSKIESTTTNQKEEGFMISENSLSEALVEEKEDCKKKEDVENKISEEAALVEEKEDCKKKEDVENKITEEAIVEEEEEDCKKNKNDEDLIRIARGEAWRHRSSWTQLISNTNQTCFSISQIVPNLSFEQIQPENKNLNDTEMIINDQSPAFSVKNNTLERKITISSSSDTCPFMRTEASLKEWKKAKESRINKKKKAVK